MRKILKFLMIILMLIGVIFSALNIISIVNIAGDCTEFLSDEWMRSSFTGTQQPDGCYGEPLNCPPSKK